MKIKIPAKTVDACDICERPSSIGLLDTCVVCRRKYCHTCEAIMAGCIHQPDVCKTCGALPKARETVERFAYPLLDVLKQRDKALSKLKAP